MIISASRRTDIPRFFMDWFMARLQEGYALVRNPMNHAMVSRVPLDRDAVECIAFWSKDPEPIRQHLPSLAPYPFFIQFTLNPYGPEIEAGLPSVEKRLETFRRLSDAIGPQGMLWRYSPVLHSRRYTEQRHLEDFARLARGLAGYTERCRIGFLDVYPKIQPALLSLGIDAFDESSALRMGLAFAEIARENGISVGGCGKMNPDALGWKKEGCISREMVSAAMGSAVQPGKDGGQPGHCHCLPSVDLGRYNCCPHGCIYCYANRSRSSAAERRRLYDAASPMLCDKLGAGDEVKLRAGKSCRDAQISLFE